MVVAGVAGAHLSVPVKGEAYLVQLLAIAVYVAEGGYLGMLPRLYGILLCGQTVRVVAHGVEHIVALLTLEAGIDVAGYVAQGMAHVQAGAAGVGEHVQDIELLLRLVFGHMVCLVGHPAGMPFGFDAAKVVLSHLKCLMLIIPTAKVRYSRRNAK